MVTYCTILSKPQMKLYHYKLLLVQSHQLGQAFAIFDQPAPIPQLVASPHPSKYVWLTDADKGKECAQT